jgi:hypothetical protein
MNLSESVSEESLRTAKLNVKVFGNSKLRRWDHLALFNIPMSNPSSSIATPNR